MIPASILVIIDLIVVTGFTLYNIFKNKSQDKRLDGHEVVIDELVRQMNKEAGRVIITPPPREG